MENSKYQVAWSSADNLDAIYYFDCVATTAMSAITQVRYFLRHDHQYGTGDYVIREVYCI